MARRMPMPGDEYTRAFESEIKKLASGKAMSTVFADFTTMLACTISNAVDSAHEKQREKLYMDAVKRYTKDELPHLVSLSSITMGAMLSNPDRDFLGAIYTGLGLLDSSKSQFFTPYHICKLMALLSGDEPKQELAKRGFISVSDPCCGAGAMLIAHANAMKEADVDVARDVLYVAQDLDFQVAKMCYIQLSLMGCSAVVRVGNSLSMEDVPLESTWLSPAMFTKVWVDRGFMTETTEPPEKAG